MALALMPVPRYSVVTPVADTSTACPAGNSLGADALVLRLVMAKVLAPPVAL